MKTIQMLAGFIMVIAIISCEENESENERQVSAHMEDDSHQTGRNCMECHKKGGSGEGWFTVAGSVYDSITVQNFQSAYVELYTGPNATGTKVLSLEVDEKGNYYTTEPVNFGDGLYPVLIASEKTRAMISKSSNGHCNACHTGSTHTLWTN